MKCFNCGAEAPAGNKFCPRCGASMSAGQAGAPGMSHTVNRNPDTGQMTPGNMSAGYLNQGSMGHLNQDGTGYPARSGTQAAASVILGIACWILIGLAVLNSATKRVLGIDLYINESVALLGFVLIFAGMVCAIVGFIMAIYSLAKKKPRKGMAVAGLICSGIPVVFFIWGALTNL